MLSLKELVVLLPNRAHPSVVRLNRLLELNSGPLWWCCLFSNSNGLRDKNVAVVEIITISFHSLNSLTLLAR